MKRRILKIIAVLAALLVLTVGIFIAVFDLDKTVNTQKDNYLPELEKLLGRKVEIGPIKTTLLPILGAEIRAVKVAGAGADGPPLQIGAIRFGVKLWAALKSFGKDVQLKELVIDGLVVDVTRHADGSLSIDDILARLADGPPPEETPKPLDPKAREFIENLKLQRVALVGAAVRFRDEATGGAPALIEVGDLNIEISDATLAQPLAITLTAAVFGAAKNLELRTQVGPIPLGEPAPLPIAYLALALDGLDLAPIVPYLGEALPVGLKSARINGALRIDDPLDATEGRRITSDLKVAGLAFDGGQAFALALAGALATPKGTGRLEIRDLVVKVDEMQLGLRGNLTGLNTGRLSVEGARLTSEGLHFGELLKRLPPLQAALPRGALLDGPFTLAGELDGDADERRVGLNLDLSPSRLRVPGAIDKPAGAPLALLIDLLHTGPQLTVRQGELKAGPMKLVAQGKIDDLDGIPKLDLTADTGRFDIDGLVRLLPAVSGAVPPDVKIAGNAQISAKAQGGGETFNGSVRLQLTGADLRAPGATLVGSGSVSVQARRAGGLSASLSADLSGLTLKAGDAVDKAAGVPCKADIDLARAGERLSFNRFDVVFGPIQLKGSGGMAQDGRGADIKLGLADFKLAELARILPSAIEGPLAQAEIGLDAGIKGDLNAPDQLTVSLDALRFKHGRSSLRGNASYKGGSKPVIRFDVQAPVLDVDALAPPDPNAPADEGGGPVVIPEIVKQIDARGRVRIGEGSARGYTFRDFDGQVTLQNGRLSFERLDLKIFDGSFSAARTVADLRPTPPTLKIRLALRQINAAAMLDQLAGTGSALKGRLGTTVEVDGKGLDWATLSQNITGGLDLQLKDGQLEGASLEQALFDPIQRRLPMLGGKRAQDLGLRSLAGRFEVKDGKLNLKEPMTADTPQGPLTLTGAIGLDLGLDLTGRVQLQPELIRRISGGKINPAAPIPVGLKLGGSLTSPAFTGVETDALATALLTSAAGAQVAAAKAEAERLAAEARARAQREVDQAKARAQQETDRAKARAQQEADRAKARAQEEKDKAKNKAKDEAKKRVKGLF